MKTKEQAKIEARDYIKTTGVKKAVTGVVLLGKNIDEDDKTYLENKSLSTVAPSFIELAEKISFIFEIEEFNKDEAEDLLKTLNLINMADRAYSAVTSSLLFQLVRSTPVGFLKSLLFGSLRSYGIVALAGEALITHYSNKSSLR